MLRFLRLENLILPASQIKSITTPTVNGQSIVEIAIFALTDTFKFDGQAAARVYDQLQNETASPAPTVPSTIAVTVNGVPTVPAYLVLPGETIPSIVTLDGVGVNTDTIEWADLATDFGNGQIGVELRLSTDAPGITHQYLGDNASQVYDVLAALVPEVAAAA
jgi:hypothetical protein